MKETDFTLYLVIGVLEKDKLTASIPVRNGRRSLNIEGHKTVLCISEAQAVSI